MRKQLLQLRDPLGIPDAIDTEPKIGTIDPEVGETIVSKIATRIEPNVFEVTIWHESDFYDKPEWADDTNPFVKLTIVSAFWLVVLAAAVAIVAAVMTGNPFLLYACSMIAIFAIIWAATWAGE